MTSDKRLPLLRAEAIRRTYGTEAILDGVSLVLYPGTLTLLRGHNGSGKSTLLNCLSGFDLHYRGEVFLAGMPLRRKGPDVRARLGLVRTFQHPHLFGQLVVKDQLTLGVLSAMPAWRSYLCMTWRSADTKGPLPTPGKELLGDLLGRPGDTLSVGEMKVVNTLRVLATGARTLLLDEPLASLHGRLRQLLVQVLLSQRASGCALLVVEHHIPELAAEADAVFELTGGKLLQRYTL